MTQPFKFRYVNEIAGGFVLLSVCVLVLGIYVAGHAQGWFEPRLNLKVRFSPEEGTFGLQEGAEVRILGTLAGRVGEIVAVDEGSMETTLTIKGRFHSFVRKDSVAKVRKKFAIAGDAFVEITLGDPRTPTVENEDYIRCEQDEEIFEAARQAVDDVRAQLLPVLEEVRQILSHVNGVTRNLEEGQGTAGRLISDPELAANVTGIVAEVRLTAARLPVLASETEAILQNLRALTPPLNQTANRFPELAAETEGILRDVRTLTGALTGEVGNVRGVLLQTQSTLRETERLIEGLENHWLLRRYVPSEEAVPLLPAGTLPGRAGP